MPEVFSEADSADCNCGRREGDVRVDGVGVGTKLVIRTDADVPCVGLLTVRACPDTLERLRTGRLALPAGIGSSYVRRLSLKRVQTNSTSCLSAASAVRTSATFCSVILAMYSSASSLSFWECSEATAEKWEKTTCDGVKGGGRKSGGNSGRCFLPCSEGPRVFKS